jgi:ubiquinone/menaquinone biosynthesis C-methylase UbiE
VTDPGQLFDEYATEYDATIQNAIGASGESVLFFAELRAGLIARAIGSGNDRLSMLDFGCGIGNMTRAVAKLFPRAEFVGTDLSDQSLARARQVTGEPERIRFVTTLSNRLPFDDATFDVAFTSGVFHHIELADRLHWARELRRVLKSGGRIFLFEHNPLNPLTLRVVRSIPFDRDVVLLGAGYTVRLLHDAGFATSRPHYYFFFPRFLRALRPLEQLLRRVPAGAQYFVIGRS